MAKIIPSFSTLLNVNAMSLCLSEGTWMYYCKGTYGLMIGFKAALADTSRDFFWAADWPDWRQSIESAE